VSKKDGELSDEDLEKVVGGSKDMKVLLESWSKHLKEGVNIKVSALLSPKDKLNSELWDEDKKLRPEVRDRLMRIAEKFIKPTLGKGVTIKDITFTGSLANYNYSDMSDIDLHIIISFADINKDKEMVRKYFNAVKALWNSLHDIRIKGFEVEAYVQDSDEPHTSTGVYSVQDDRWLKEPTQTEAEIDEDSVSNKTNSLIDQIEQALKIMEEGSPEQAMTRAESLMEKIKKLRKAGLESEGEYSVENLAFKTLRNTGYLTKLSDLKREAYDAMMSIEEKMDNPCWKGYEMVGMKKKGGKEVPNCVPIKEAEVEEAKSKAKGKRFSKKVKDSKTGRTRTVNYGQSGKAKDGGDRIRPGTAKGDAYCARSAKIKKCKKPPCANDLSRKKWKCRGSKSVAESLKLTESQLYRMVKEELIKEFTLTGIDVPRIVSLRRPIKKRSKAKEPIQRIETDLHATQDTVDRLEEFTREIYNMLIKIIRKNK
jgi:hypothetical protein